MRLQIVQLGLLLFVFVGCKNATPTIYLIPRNYEGTIAVVYSQKKGLEKKTLNGNRLINIPNNGILLTQFDFSDGGRDDLFLMRTDKGYDTLKSYLPNMDTTGKKFGGNYYSVYTRNINEVAVNFRQIVNTSPANDNDKPCNFEYELITIGKVATLSDSSNKAFIEHLDKYLKDTVCR